MKNLVTIFLATAAFIACISSGNAQAWRNCIQNSIGPGGCGAQSGRAVVNRLVLEAARRSAQVGGCRSGLVGASQLGQEGAYRSLLAAGSAPIGIGAANSIQGKYPTVTAFSLSLSLEHSRSEMSAKILKLLGRDLARFSERALILACDRDDEKNDRSPQSK